MRSVVLILAAAVFPALALAGHPDHAGPHPASGAERFTVQERGEIKGYFAAHPEARSQLPPGLAKKGKVPPGWRKKLARGKPVPADVWEQRAPLPEEIRVKLPVPPEGVVLVRIHDRVVKVRESTRELIDVLGL